jgi:hypothetical protein
MSFLAPWWLAAGAAMAAVVVVLHLLARRRPRVLLFPTARFVPDRPATAASLATRPTDLPVMLTRVLFLFLLGAALAQPILAPPRRTIQIVLLDQFGPADSAAAENQTADAVIPFQGSLSAGLVAALRAAPGLARRGDSVGLTIVSPFGIDAFDEATLKLREQWNGRISLVITPRVAGLAATGSVLSPEDPLAATLALAASPQGYESRLVRGRPAPDDSAWALNGGSLVVWPPDPEELNWPSGPGDTVGGVASGDVAVVAAFTRAYSPPGGTLAAVWADGKPAATTSPWGRGCIRNIAIPVAQTGDLVLRRSVLQLTRKLMAPCSGQTNSERASDSLLDSLRGQPSLRPAITVERAERKETPADPWLLVGAALVFAVEPLIRRKRVG